MRVTDRGKIRSEGRRLGQLVAMATAAALCLSVAACSSSGGGSAGQSSGATTAETQSTPAGGSGSGSGSSQPAQTTDVTLMLSYPMGPSNGAVALAGPLGYYKEAGLNVKYEVAQGSGLVAQQLAAGKADFGYATSPAFVPALAKTPSLKVPYCLHVKSMFHLYVTDGSSVTNISQLKGKTIGVESVASGGTYLLNAALREAGIDPKTGVHEIAVGDDTAAKNALTSGKVAAYMAAIYQVIPWEAQGLKLRDVMPAKYSDVPGACLLVSGSVLDSDSGTKTVVALTQAWAKASEYMAASPDKGLSVLCKAYASQCTSKQATGMIVDGTFDLMQPGTDKPWGFVNPDGWNLLLKALQEAGVVKDGINIDSSLESDQLSKIHTDYMDFDKSAVDAKAKAGQ